jgi:hypothetical protein
VENLALEKWPKKSKCLKIVSIFLVEEFPCKISALRVFPVAQNLGTFFGFRDLYRWLQRG